MKTKPNKPNKNFETIFPIIYFSQFLVKLQAVCLQIQLKFFKDIFSRKSYNVEQLFDKILSL